MDESTTRLASDTRVLVFDIENPEPFELPALGHFGGSSAKFQPDGKTIDKNTIRPWTFTPGTVKVRIENGKITDIGAFSATRSFYGVTDACQGHRSVYDSGVAPVHWPDWLSRLVTRAVAGAIEMSPPVVLDFTSPAAR